MFSEESPSFNSINYATYTDVPTYTDIPNIYNNQSDIVGDVLVPFYIEVKCEIKCKFLTRGDRLRDPHCDDLSQILNTKNIYILKWLKSSH